MSPEFLPVGPIILAVNLYRGPAEIVTAELDIIEFTSIKILSDWKTFPESLFYSEAYQRSTEPKEVSKKPVICHFLDTADNEEPDNRLPLRFNSRRCERCHVKGR